MLFIRKNDVTHSSEGFDDSLETCEIERCSVSEPVFKHNHCAPGIHHKNVVLGRSLISSQVKKSCQQQFPAFYSTF